MTKQAYNIGWEPNGWGCSPTDEAPQLSPRLNPYIVQSRQDRMVLQLHQVFGLVSAAPGSLKTCKDKRCVTSQALQKASHPETHNGTSVNTVGACWTM